MQSLGESDSSFCPRTFCQTDFIHYWALSSDTHSTKPTLWIPLVLCINTHTHTHTHKQLACCRQYWFHFVDMYRAHTCSQSVCTVCRIAQPGFMFTWPANNTSRILLVCSAWKFTASKTACQFWIVDRWELWILLEIPAHSVPEFWTWRIYPYCETWTQWDLKSLPTLPGTSW